jgi:hypothetical protein
MDLASLALIAAGISIVLQIIVLVFVIVLVSRNRPVAAKALPATLTGSGSAPVPQNRFNNQGRRDQQENRFNRRPLQEPRPVQPPPPPAGQSVDTSLRDINLRLKNAERSQENERKRLSGNFSRDNRGNDHGDRDNRDNRGGRGDHRGNRGDNRGGGRGDYRGHNRPNNDRGGQYQGDRQEGNDQRPPSFEAPVSPMAAPAIPNIAAPVFEQQQPVLAPVPQSIAPATAATENSAHDNNQELFHGRKNTVTRHIPPSAEQSNGQAGSENTPPQNSADNSANQSTDAPDNSNIIFGRRRG